MAIAWVPVPYIRHNYPTIGPITIGRICVPASSQLTAINGPEKVTSILNSPLSFVVVDATHVITKMRWCCIGDILFNPINKNHRAHSEPDTPDNLRTQPMFSLRIPSLLMRHAVIRMGRLTDTNTTKKPYPTQRGYSCKTDHISANPSRTETMPVQHEIWGSSVWINDGSVFCCHPRTQLATVFTDDVKRTGAGKH